MILEASERNKIAPIVLKFIQENRVPHCFAKYGYEIDELRRDINLLNAADGNNFQLALHHDQTVMEPGALVSGSGKQMKVFPPCHKVWCSEVAEDPSLLDTVPALPKNADTAKKTPDKPL